MRLRNRIGGAMAAVTLAGVAVTGLLTWVRIDRTIREESEREVADATATLAGEWRALGSELTGELARIVQERTFRTGLNRLSLGQVPPGAVEIADLAPRLIRGRELNYLQIFDADGRTLSSGPWRIRGGREDPEGWSIVTRPSPEAVVHTRTVGGKPEVAIESSITVEMNDREYHVVGGRRITPDVVANLVSNLGGRGYVNMRDSTRIMPEGVAPENLDRLLGAEQHTIDGRTFVVGRAPGAETDKIVMSPIRGADGTVVGDVVLRLSQARLVNLARELSWAFLGVAAIGLVSAWAVGFWFARRITRPVEQLALAARRVGVGRAPGAMPPASDDEVGDLVRSFRRMTDDLAESRRELVRAERLAAWRDIAQRMAHEIKNALSPIQISVETIQRSQKAGHAELPRIVDESVEAVRHEVRGLRNLVNEFSQFARMPDLEVREQPVNPPVERAAVLHAANGRDVRVETRLASVLPHAPIDADALARAVGNLVLNAVEATPPGGTVTVSTGSTESGGVEIVVDDQGPGVPPTERDRIFEPYYTTKPSGTGLGLAMVWKIVSEHGGRIEIHDAPERGARFRVVLPPRPARGEGGAAPPRRAGPPAEPVDRDVPSAPATDLRAAR
jgi:two-component system nitrogen regulation sensor histidine kinase NtrY